MRSALGLARRGLGSTWPNPSVGCVIVRDGCVVARGRTGDGGRPHAEQVALAQAGPLARGATAYVTLEPCSHHGHTPPCADAFVAAGIARAVISVSDPDPRVDGRGLRRLRDGGIKVQSGVLPEAGAAVLAGFAKRITTGRPLVTLKLATTLDGRIATGQGESRWITGPAARRVAHALRGRQDAVLVGIGTALADDPDLTCRIPGYRVVPVVRVVLDAQLRLSPGSRLAATARETPTWVLHAPEACGTLRHAALDEAGVKLIPIAAASERGTLDAAAALAALAREGLTRVLVEGGAKVAASLLRAGLVDRIAWFHAPFAIGDAGLPAVARLGDVPLADIFRFRRSREPSGLDADIVSLLHRSAA